MSKYTPGPWKYGAELSSRTGEWLISFDAGNRGRGIGIAETRPGSGQEEANARLIAAAPELLEALVLLMKHSAKPSCGSLHHDKKDRHDAFLPCPAEVRLYNARIMAEDAIAKAKGEK